MDIKIINSASDIPDDQWARLSGNPYESKGWFMANQECFRDIRFYYLCAYGDTGLESILPVYDTLPKVYVIQLDQYFGRYVDAAKRLNYLISGSPYSNNSDIIGNRLYREVCNFSQQWTQ
jgi:hypothetical protein